MRKLARFVVNKKLVCIIVFAVLLLACVVSTILTYNDVNYNDSAYLPKNSSLKKGLNAMYGEFGDGGNASIMLSDTTVGEAVEFKSRMEGIEGVASVIWIDDILMSDAIGISGIMQEMNESGVPITKAQCVEYMWTIIGKIGSGSIDLNGYDLANLTVAQVNQITTAMMADVPKTQFYSYYPQFILNMTSLMGAAEGFDISSLDAFMPQLAMFYTERDGNGDGEIEGYALFQISLTKSDYDKVSVKALDAISELEDGGRVAMVGNSASTRNSIKSVSKETSISMIVAGVIVVIILILTTTAFWEPVLLLLTIGVAILLNMGTNFFVGWITGIDGISYMTQGVASVLQLALTMDYCIYVLHRFKEERKKGRTSNEAMVEALVASFSPVSASSLTTIASFVALMFMSYRLGLDMGVVLAKGTLFSLLSVFFFMPALVLYTEKLINKTEHKTFNFSFKRFSKGLVKSRFYVPFIIIAIMAPCVYLQAQNDFTYGPTASLGGEGSQIAIDTAAVEGAFGKQNQVVALIPISCYEDGTELVLVQELSKIEGVEQVQSRAAIESMAGEFAQVLPQKFYQQFQVADDPQYSRVVMFLDAPEEGAKTTAIINAAQGVLDEKTDGQGYLLGSSSATLAIADLVNKDYDIITYVSLGLVVLILLITFKSIVIPAILVLVIQGSIYVNMAIPYLMGDSIVFVGYMLVSSILLGATIDYAILLTSRYMEHRLTMNKYDAVQHALADSSRTLITSAGILTFAGASIQFVTSLPATRIFGGAVMRGGICAFILVLVLLPQLLLLCDKAIKVTSWKGKERMIDNRIVITSPEIEESSVTPKLPRARKRYTEMTSGEREDAIMAAILESIDNPDFDPDDD